MAQMRGGFVDQRKKKTTTVTLDVIQETTAPPPVSPPSIREESAEASPRLLAEGFDDKETNLVTEASAGPGDVEGSAAGGANLQISAWSLLFLCLLLPLCQNCAPRDGRA